MNLGLTPTRSKHSFERLNSPSHARNYLPRYRVFAGLLGLTAATIAIHGHHVGVEDQAIYIPAILKHLDPALFQRDAVFFEAQTRPTLIDETYRRFLENRIRAYFSFTGVPLILSFKRKGRDRR